MVSPHLSSCVREAFRSACADEVYYVLGYEDGLTGEDAAAGADLSLRLGWLQLGDVVGGQGNEWLPRAPGDTLEVGLAGGGAEDGEGAQARPGDSVRTGQVSPEGGGGRGEGKLRGVPATTKTQ